MVRTIREPACGFSLVVGVRRAGLFGSTGPRRIARPSGSRVVRRLGNIATIGLSRLFPMSGSTATKRNGTGGEAARRGTAARNRGRGTRGWSVGGAEALLVSPGQGDDAEGECCHAGEDDAGGSLGALKETTIAA